jgi:hypothetical protein
MRRMILLAVATATLMSGASSAAPATMPSRATAAADVDAAPVAAWSTEARRAIVPSGPGGIFGTENYGNKFPGEAAVYMGIVHTAIYDAAVAIEGGGYKQYAIKLTAPPGTSPAAAIATAAHETLVGLQPQLGLTPAQLATLDGDYAAYLGDVSDGEPKVNGIRVGEKVAAALLALRSDDGREKNPTLADLNPPAAGPGVWDPGAALALGLRLPGMRPLALESASQFRPHGPYSLTSDAYAKDFAQVEELGRLDSAARTAAETTDARFWTDHDLRQWNDGMLRLAAARGLDLVNTARMLAMAHVAGGDAMIACFDAKYHYWFWRPYQAIPLADTDGNPNTEADSTWKPLGATPNFPEYPSAHACHSGAVTRALRSFFGTDKVHFSLDSRITGTTRDYNRLSGVVKDVNRARVLVGFHFFSSDQAGAALGRKVANYDLKHAFLR